MNIRLMFRGIVGITIGLLTLCTTVSGTPDTTMLNTICNGQQYFPLGPFTDTVNAALDDLSANTATHGYNYYSAVLDSTGPCWAHGACNGVLGPPDCTACINSARQQLFYQCTHAIGGQIQLQDCRVRYEDYSFTE
ncbi:hypothetical protein NL676_039352 [Syzygium grande]|nr:hypothetical protein NL676_039352 [Syzygium grande]